MKKPEIHILVCNSYRVSGDAQGVCNKKGAVNLVPYIIEGCADRGLDAVVTTTACLSVCEKGPVMVVHPLNFWYGKVNGEDEVDEILDALKDGELCEKYSIAD
ncbi:MAG: (2Fe-2S) ferredoxin domain-containing protein [Bacteroidales bacterium]|nr:(2Fe-2S) ferredoxin domain-containing protein [Bacteroidales bacterium]